MKHTVLFVATEPEYVNLLRPYFVHADFECHNVKHGNSVSRWMDGNHCDLVVLDVSPADIDGFGLCRQLAARQVGILILSDDSTEHERLLGLEAGADDYLNKSCSSREIVVRAKAVLRRLYHSSPQRTSLSGLTLNSECYSAVYLGEHLTLTAVEFHLLKQLFHAYGSIVSREKLLDGMYQDNRVVSQRTIDSHIKNIRKKFKSLYPEKEFIQSVYGVGYKLNIETVKEDICC